MALLSMYLADAHAASERPRADYEPPPAVL